MSRKRTLFYLAVVATADPNEFHFKGYGSFEELTATARGFGIEIDGFNGAVNVCEEHANKTFHAYLTRLSR